MTGTLPYGKAQNPAYRPADYFFIERIKVNLYDKLNNSGSEKIGLKDREEFKEVWKTLNEAYSLIKDKADNMKISDL